MLLHSNLIIDRKTMNAAAPSQLEQLRDYANQLKRHTKGRRAVHIHLSRLEKHHQESVFKREASANIKPLIDKFSGTRNFALSNNDLMLITNGASLDDIEPAMVQIRKQFNDDPLIKQLDPVQGRSDDFAVWYDLEKDFQEFLESIKLMCAAEKAGKQLLESFQPSINVIKKSTVSNMADDGFIDPHKKKKTRRAVKIVRTDARKEVPKVTLNAETVLKLSKFINVMDITAYMRPQDIVAIVGKGKPTVAMIERSIKTEEVVHQLIKEVDLDSNSWLKGYLSDIISERMVLSEPELKNKKSLASMVPLTANCIVGPHFATFEKGHNSVDKSAIIIEISLVDLLSDSVRYKEAEDRARTSGYKLAIGSIDPLAFTALDISMLDVDFFKIRWRASMKDWLQGDNLKKFKKALTKIGLPRVIITDCDSAESIKLMRSCGAILFQGSAVDGYQS